MVSLSERPPGALGLGQAVRDDEQDGRMVSHPAMAAAHFDALPLRAPLLETAPPRDDPVAAAVDGRGRHGERYAGRRMRPGRRAVAASAEEPPDARGRRVTKRARERDHLAHVARKAARELARIDAAQAPADQAEAAAMTLAQRREALGECRPERAARSVVPAEPPTVRMVTAVAEEPAERLRRTVAREPARQHEHGMSVADRGAAEQRQRRHQRGELEPRAALEGEQCDRWGRYRLHGWRRTVPTPRFPRQGAGRRATTSCARSPQASRSRSTVKP